MEVEYSHALSTELLVAPAAVKALLEIMVEQEHEDAAIDRALLDTYQQNISQEIDDMLNTILHHPDFQQLERSWRGLDYVLQAAPAHKNTRIDILNVSKQELIEDFAEAELMTQSGLYDHVYRQEYDTPGGEPFAAMIADYHIENVGDDLRLLKNIAEVAAVAQCPFIANADSQLFHKNHITEVMELQDVSAHLHSNDYAAWQQFRLQENAKYIGLTLPKFILREPYAQEHCEKHQDFCWGAASYAFARNLLKSFIRDGWAVNIRGPESGGKVSDLPMYRYEVGYGIQTKMPLETLVPESKELELANLGFIPLSYYKNSDYACFFSASSLLQPKQYIDDEDTANSQLSGNLPYLFLTSRIAHYLKVLQREYIGSNRSASVLKQDLNKWLQTLVTTMPNPQPDIIASHPLREASVEVEPKPDQPGYYRVQLFVVPHFQLESVDLQLSLVSTMPGEKT